MLEIDTKTSRQAFAPLPPAFISTDAAVADGRQSGSLRKTTTYLNTARPGANAFRRAISRLDDRLSRHHCVREFTASPECLLRYALVTSPASVLLSDGACIQAGELIADLHLWNAHIPPIPKGGPNLAWARHTCTRLHHSLQELARVSSESPDLREVRACRARVNFAGRGCSRESLSRLIGRFGFEDVDEGSTSMQGAIHDVFENVLIGALVWTHNPVALRRDKLIRGRRPVWMSRERLLSRFLDSRADAQCRFLAD